MEAACGGKLRFAGNSKSEIRNPKTIVNRQSSIVNHIRVPAAAPTPARLAEAIDYNLFNSTAAHKLLADKSTAF